MNYQNVSTCLANCEQQLLNISSFLLDIAIQADDDEPRIKAISELSREMARRRREITEVRLGHKNHSNDNTEIKP